MNTTLEKPKTTTDSHTMFGLSVTVELSDLDKIVIDVPVKEWQNGNYVSTGTEKYLLEKLYYRTNDEEFILDHIGGRGFRRDKKLRVRDSWSYDITQEVIDQIPASYHEYAKEQFEVELAEVEKELLAIKAKGLIVKARK